MRHEKALRLGRFFFATIQAATAPVEIVRPVTCAGGVEASVAFAVVRDPAAVGCQQGSGFGLKLAQGSSALRVSPG